MRLRTVLAGWACVSFTTLAAAASPAPGGAWTSFDVDELTAADGGLGWIDIGDGAALSIDFTVATGDVATLTVVDGGFAGDRFDVFNGSALLGRTSAATQGYPQSIGLDFDAALADPAYSRSVFTLGAGSYRISGVLAESALVEGLPINATVGGLRVVVSPVPEPATVVSMLAGLALLAAARRRA